MEFKKQVESLRRATLVQREAAARAAPQRSAEFMPYQRLRGAWCRCCAMRWLNVYPLLAVLVGVVFMVYVKQTREILADLQQDLIFVERARGVGGVDLVLDARSSSTDFPGDEEGIRRRRIAVAQRRVAAPRAVRGPRDHRLHGVDLPHRAPEPRLDRAACCGNLPVTGPRRGSATGSPGSGGRSSGGRSTG